MTSSYLMLPSFDILGLLSLLQIIPPCESLNDKLFVRVLLRMLERTARGAEVREIHF